MMSFASYRCFYVRILWIAISFFANSGLFAQFYDLKDLQEQLRSQNIEEIHVILGGGLGIEQVSDEDYFFELIRSRLPQGASKIPVLLMQESDRLISTPSGLQIVQSSLSYIVEELRGSSLNPNFRAIRFSNETPQSRLDKLLQYSFDLDSFGKIFDTATYDVSPNYILDKQYDKYSRIEDISTAGEYANDPLNFIFSAGFKKVHFTILGGNDETLLSIIKIFSQLRIIDADQFEEISVAFFTRAMGAAINYLGAIGYDLVDKFPHVELLVYNSEEGAFIPLESYEGRSSLIEYKDIAENLDPIFNRLKMCTPLHFNREEDLGRFFFVEEKSSNKPMSLKSINKMLLQKGVALAFRNLGSSEEGFHFSLSIEDHFSASNFLELKDKHGQVHKIESGFLEFSNVENSDTTLEQFIFVLRGDQFETLRVGTRVGIIEFSAKEIQSYVDDKFTLGLPGMIYRNRESILRAQLDFDFSMKIAHFVASDDRLSLFNAPLVLDHEDLGVSWMLSSESDQQIAESLLTSFRSAHGENCMDVFNLFTDKDVPDLNSLSQAIGHYRKWIKLEKAKNASRISNFRKKS